MKTNSNANKILYYTLNLTKSPRQRRNGEKPKNQPKNDPLARPISARKWSSNLAIFSRVVKKRIGIVYSILRILIKALDFL